MSLLNNPGTPASCGASMLNLAGHTERNSPTCRQQRTFFALVVAKASGWIKVCSFLLICLVASALSGCGSGIVKTSTGVVRFTSEMVNFGDVPVGQAQNSDVGILNSGGTAILISALNVAGQTFSSASQFDPISIPAGGTHTLKLSFAPTSSTDFSGQLTLMSASAEPMAVIGMHGRGGKANVAQLVATASSLDFGTVTIGSTRLQPLTLTATGNAPVTISSAALAGTDFSLVGAQIPLTLSPGQAVTLQVQLKPAAAGSLSSQLAITSNATGGRTDTIALSGVGSVPVRSQLAINPAALAFGSINVGTAKILFVTLSSTGNAPVTVNAAGVSGSGYTLIGATFPVTVIPSQGVPLQVKFAPTVASDASGQLSISSNSSGGSPTTVALSGTGIAAPNPQLSLSLTRLSFGNVEVNVPATLAVVLTSTGTSPVTVNAASISGTGYTLIGAAFPITLNPGQTATLQVKFAPTAAGSESGQLIVSSDAAGGSSAAVALSGTGIAAANAQLSLSLTQLSFGDVTINAPATLALVLTSTGTSPVTVNAASITGSGYTLIGAAFPITLSPGQTATLQVKFAPTVAGGASGQLTVSSNSSGVISAAVALSGTGVAALNPQLSLNLTQLSFGNVTINVPATLTLILTSTGSSPVTVNASTITGTGFTLVSPNPRVTLDPTQSLALQIQFDPQTIGASTGQLTISSNSLSGSSVVVTLTGRAVALNPILTASPASLSFGSIAVNTTSILSLTLRSTGTTAVTVSSASISGAGYTILGGLFPITLDPGQTATLQVQLKPGTSGDAAGQLTLRSDSVNGSTVVVALGGTGQATAHQVDLTWDAAAASPSPVTGYNVYRFIGNAAPVLLNTAPNVSTSYVDTTVVSSNSYNYIVKSVDASGSESVASNQIQLVIP